MGSVSYPVHIARRGGSMSAPETARNRPDWSAVLRAIEPVKTAACIAARIGAPVGTVEGWIKRSTSPSGEWVCRLIAAYGIDLLLRLFGKSSPAWLTRAEMIERLDALDAQAARLRAEFAELKTEGRRAGL